MSNASLLSFTFALKDFRIDSTIKETEVNSYSFCAVFLAYLWSVIDIIYTRRFFEMLSVIKNNALLELLTSEFSEAAVSSPSRSSPMHKVEPHYPHSIITNSYCTSSLDNVLFEVVSFYVILDIFSFIP